MPMPRKDDNILKYFEPYENKRYTIDEQDIKKDYKDLISKC